VRPVRGTWRVRDGGPDDLVRWLRQGRIDIAWTTIEASTRNALVLRHEPFFVLAVRDAARFYEASNRD
jgi:hypothetical protein